MRRQLSLPIVLPGSILHGAIRRLSALMMPSLLRIDRDNIIALWYLHSGG